MLELPDGITTSDGNWYHITSTGAEKYIPGLLKKYRLERIIQDADAWLKCPDIFALLFYFMLILLSVNPWVSAMAALLFYLLLFFNISTIALPAFSPVARWFHSDGLSYILITVFLIYFSLFNLKAMWIGAALVFLLKVGLLRLTLKYITGKISSATPMADRVLNMLFIRLGLREGLLNNRVEAMEKQLLQQVNQIKKKKK